jgi:hypothetical protein
MTTSKRDKIKELEDQMGCSDLEMLNEALMDGVAMGICMNEGCDYTTEVEPDQDRGWCEACETNTVSSICILKGVI